MRFEGGAELRVQHGLFSSCLDPIAGDDQDDSDDAAPAVDGEHSADGGQIESGINGMAEIGVRSGADQLVVILMVTRALQYWPRCQRARERARCRSRSRLRRLRPGRRTGEKCGGLETDLGVEGELSAFAIHEEQDKTDNFQQEDAVARGEGSRRTVRRVFNALAHQ